MDSQDTQNQNSIRRPTIRDVQIDRATRAVQGAANRRVPTGGEKGRGWGFTTGWWVLAAALLVAASIISLPIVFSDTTLQVTPVVTKAAFDNATFTASAKGAEATGLMYDSVVWSNTASKTLEPTDRKVVEEKASGMITVYNNYTTQPQRLIKNTRFETSDGRVYRVRESINIPGKTSAGPGSLDITVYADEAGDRYNVEAGASLTLPGLKTIPDMYTGIYAKTKSALAGGFSGERAVVSDEAKTAAVTELKAELEKQAGEEIKGRLPENAVYFKGGVFTTFADPIEKEVEGKVQVDLTANTKVVTFDATQFANTIAVGVVGNPSSGDARISKPEDLTVDVTFDADTEDALGTAKLVVNGNADFIWLFDEETLKKDLAGKNREALRTILNGYPSIKSAAAIVRPFWRSSFPSNTHDFTIELVDVE